jgi:hypothetical protein
MKYFVSTPEYNGGGLEKYNSGRILLKWDKEEGFQEPLVRWEFKDKTWTRCARTVTELFVLNWIIEVPAAEAVLMDGFMR